jgi:Chitobiase/beta-hexosaminidase C-terminal domain
MQLVSTNWTRTKRKQSGWLGLIAGLGLFAFAPGLRAQINYLETNVTVSTIGGGPLAICGPVSGFTDGNTFDQSQFKGPVSIALNSQGTLFVADRTNNAIREVTLAGNTSSSETITILTNSLSLSKSQVVALTVDAGDNLYILVQGDNELVKYNSSLNALFAYPLPSTPAALSVSLDANTNIFIAFTNGLILELAQNGTGITGTNTIVAAGAVKWLPAGIAWRKDGVLAVSDLKKNIIYEVSSLSNSVPVAFVPTQGATNWIDGSPRYVAFNQPTGIVWSEDGQLIVADSGNSALRRVDASGNVSTIYGVSSKGWNKTDCETETYAGWIDGAAGGGSTNAEGRTPVSVVIAPNGNLYVSETYYDLLREVQGLTLQPQTVTNVMVGTNTNTVVVAPPVISPAYGYYPECQTITVTSSVPTVYYTLNGTTPTTNSLTVANMAFSVPNNAYVGTFQWCNSQHDLTYLQIMAATATQNSVVVTGQTSPVNQIGFPTSAVAGIGSTAIIPLVINLQAGQQLESLQFRVEVNPTSPTTPAVSAITLLPISTNSFLNLVGPSAGNAPVNFQSFAYTTTSNNGQGLVISAAGSGTGLLVQNFAAALLLEIPVPSTALPGQGYALSVVYPSGTSDGAQSEVNLVSMANETLTVSNVQYFAGDSSPSSGYDAGQFGNGALDNTDVNNALMASVGIRVPFPFSDAYNAMDVYPETPTGEIGDGFITFLDWQHILFRSLGLETNNWVRFWAVGGVLSHEQVAWVPGGQPIPIGLPSPANAINGSPRPASVAVSSAWFRQATMSAGNISNLVPGATVSIPVSVNVLPGYSLSGLQFRAMLWPEGGAPTAAPLQFTAAAGLPAPGIYAGASSNEIVCAWSLFDPFNSPLQGSNYLGNITFQVPPTAGQGQSYSLHFTGVDGAPNLNTEYQLQSVPGSAWVASAALSPPQVTSDEWKLFYFGSLTNALAADSATPLTNGIPNWQSYLAGTNPTNAASVFQFNGAGITPGGPKGISLSWQTALDKYYVLETSSAIGATNWTPVSTNLGDGNPFSISITNQLDGARFYRIQILQP